MKLIKLPDEVEGGSSYCLQRRCDVSLYTIPHHWHKVLSDTILIEICWVTFINCVEQHSVNWPEVTSVETETFRNATAGPLSESSCNFVQTLMASSQSINANTQLSKICKTGKNLSRHFDADVWHITHLSGYQIELKCVSEPFTSVLLSHSIC